MDRLGQQPFILASVVINLGLMGLLYWEATIAERERTQERDLLYQYRRELVQVLANCNLPDGLPELPRPSH